MPNLLFEIYVEELPSAYLTTALNYLKSSLPEMLKNLSCSHKEIKVRGTPMRIVISVEGLPENTASKEVEILGPSEEAAFSNAKPTKALEGFVKKHEADAKNVFIRDTAKGRYCFIKKVTPGSPISAVIKDALPQL
ncbi:MAG: glycine--tRNA ligase subunit beta, partial [Planctomycetota bacterium]